MNGVEMRKRGRKILWEIYSMWMIPRTILFYCYEMCAYEIWLRCVIQWVSRIQTYIYQFRYFIWIKLWMGLDVYIDIHWDTVLLIQCVCSYQKLLRYCQIHRQTHEIYVYINGREMVIEPFTNMNLYEMRADFRLPLYHG